ncbi:protoporphyrinogen oxidase HemJ [Thiolapillus brandeum]|uniref:Protoporphyrinogen IX oxidase n=1 Tax=Thiolapillus brandeum TaxID=1076588 RepID=A0A7U6JIR5_9GAMM|nr:protoporphyrinogen oxidase HemJ [Thiolapillus brandeum]BAO45576.1 conserved hypothetical protein [Thiolapillus brandeum]
MSPWPWLKALHLIFMISWFAGLFYLPRLFVHHAMSQDNPTLDAKFKEMERKLYYFVTPWMILTLVFGTWMLIAGAWEAYSSMKWLHVKLLLVAILVGYHFWCGKLMWDFRGGKNRHSHQWYRWFNEFPLVLLVAIVLLAVFKPF